MKTKNIKAITTLLLCTALIFLTGSLNWSFASQETANRQCSGNKVFDCLRVTIQEMRIDEQKRDEFRELYIRAEKIAKTCTSFEATAKFLSISSVNIWGTHTFEAYNKSIESLLFSNTNCFFEAILLLNKETREAVLRKILMPIGFGDLSVIDELMDSYSNNTRFIPVTKQYTELKAKLIEAASSRP